MRQIQFVGITPENLQDSITNSIRAELEQLKKEFQPKEPTVYMTRQEVADLLQVDLSTVHNWTKAGKLTRHAIGNRVYYKRAEVEAALQPIKG